MHCDILPLLAQKMKLILFNQIKQSQIAVSFISFRIVMHQNSDGVSQLVNLSHGPSRKKSAADSEFPWRFISPRPHRMHLLRDRWARYTMSKEAKAPKKYYKIQKTGPISLVSFIYLVLFVLHIIMHTCK